MRLLGYRVGYASKAKVAHYFSGTAESKAVNPEKLYYCHRNLFRSIIKNCGSSFPWAVKNYLLFSFMMILGFIVLEPEKAVSTLKAILWNLANFKDTYAWRLKIQAERNVSEPEILTKMYLKLKRYQPAERVNLRRILNVLFEYSQLQTFQTFCKQK
jgi:hypothetical protein